MNAFQSRRWCMMMVVGALLLLVATPCVAQDKWYAKIACSAYVDPGKGPDFESWFRAEVEALRKAGLHTADLRCVITELSKPNPRSSLKVRPKYDTFGAVFYVTTLTDLPKLQAAQTQLAGIRQVPGHISSGVTLECYSLNPANRNR